MEYIQKEKIREIEYILILFFESMYLKNPIRFCFVGKSTLMDSLFNTNFESIPQNHREPNVRLDSHTYELEESNVKLKLSICDTVGYGDQVNKQDRYVFVYYYYLCISKNNRESNQLIYHNLFCRPCNRPVLQKWHFSFGDDQIKKRNKRINLKLYYCDQV